MSEIDTQRPAGSTACPTFPQLKSEELIEERLDDIEASLEGRIENFFLHERESLTDYIYELVRDEIEQLIEGIRTRRIIILPKRIDRRR